jgi:hypothetical protein
MAKLVKNCDHNIDPWKHGFQVRKVWQRSQANLDQQTGGLSLLGAGTNKGFDPHHCFFRKIFCGHFFYIFSSSQVNAQNKNIK